MIVGLFLTIFSYKNSEIQNIFKSLKKDEIYENINNFAKFFGANEVDQIFNFSFSNIEKLDKIWIE